LKADTRGVTVRTLALVSLLAALAIGSYLYTQQAKTVGPTSDLAQRAETQASAEVGITSFRAAVPELEAWFTEHQTYEGATLSPGYNVLVMRADATSYCLQAGSGTTVQHIAGPGAVMPAPGPC
jgi:hypothetical protein